VHFDAINNGAKMMEHVLHDELWGLLWESFYPGILF
jgi:hypothetical protein